MDQQIITRILHQNKEIYNRIASHFSQTRERQWSGFESFKQYIKEGDVILDVGCGNGRLLELFIDSGVKYVGIDSSEELIAIAQEKYKDVVGAEFKVMDMAELSDLQGEYNVVFVIAALHHIPSRELRLRILKNIYDHVAPDGYCVMYNWNLWIWKYRKKYMPYLLNYVYKLRYHMWSIKDAFIPWKLTEGWQPRYVHSFTLGELKKLFVRAGFTVDKLYYEWQGKETGMWGGANSVVIARKK